MISESEGEAPPSLAPINSAEDSELGRFMGWLAKERGRSFVTYAELWAWSVEDLAGFWTGVWDYFGVNSSEPIDEVLSSRDMPGAEWFRGARLNYAEHLLGGMSDADRLAVLGRSQTRDDLDLTFADLNSQVARAASLLSVLGVQRGDRVAGYLPNVPEAIVAFLATASLGAVWVGCSIELGPTGAVDRLGQVDPTVFVAAGGYMYGAKEIDRTAEVAEITARLSSVRHVLDIEYGRWRIAGARSWPDLLRDRAAVSVGFQAVPFHHPLTVLFTSGTTGRPKAIIHSHGGILLEHLKNHALSWDLGPADRMLWYTTTSWMMWNSLVSCLLVGASIVLVDGDPGYPSLMRQWEIACAEKVTFMGVSPGFVAACQSQGLDMTGLGELSVRIVGVAGAPFPAALHRWIREQLGPVRVNEGSGGTDVCTAIVQGNPLLPVLEGGISGRCLGVAARAFDESGAEVIDEPGELVITEPMPSMPVGLWGDTGGKRLRATYFEGYPHVWRHGDWVVFHRDGSCQVVGRSDATLNRGGVRLGTGEYYRVVENLEEVRDSLVVHLDDSRDGIGELLLFVVLVDGTDLDSDLRLRIAQQIRGQLSPRHVPDRILAVPVVPRTHTGKKLEVPVKRVLQGAELSEVVGADSLADPTSLDPYLALARR